MKVILETAVAQPRFSMNQVYQNIHHDADSQILTQFQAIHTALGKALGKKVIQSILRFSFFIEPVKTPKIESTKFAVRWGTEIIPRSTDTLSAKYLSLLG